MKQLIETSSRLYAKRMVREINLIRQAGKSVYAKVYAFSANTTNVRVMKVATCIQSSDIIATDYNGYTHRVAATAFIDERGEEVCATRKA